MKATISQATVVRHLKAVIKRMEDNDFTSLAEDRALRVALELAKGSAWSTALSKAAQ